MQSQYNIPLKRCTICGNEFPETSEYFYVRKKSNALRADCKRCCNERSRKQRETNKDYFCEYNKRYNRENKELIAQRGKDYREKNKDRIKKARIDNAEKRKMWMRSWYERNIDHVREYHQKNKEKHNSYGRQRYQQVKERINRVAKDWAINNRQNRAITTQKYRARKADLPDSFTVEHWEFALNYFQGRCAVCGRPLNGIFHKAHADHWIPISDPDCPGTVPHNMIPLCGGQNGCNQSKASRQPQEWLHDIYGTKKARAISNRIHGYFSLVRKIN